MRRAAAPAPTATTPPDIRAPDDRPPRPQPQFMGVQASDESSDAETLEPVKPALAPRQAVADSDDDPDMAPPRKPTVRELVDDIRDADSDHSDDDPVAPEDTVDFGDEEELDPNSDRPTRARSESPDPPAKPLPGHSESEGRPDPDPAERPAAEKPDQSPPKKKPKAKKDKDAAPLKTIKKPSAEGKAKAKSLKAKGAPLVKKRDTSPKKKPSSPKGSPSNSPDHSPSASPKQGKKSAAKPAAKATQKGSAKPTAKPKLAAKTSEKAAKPKKVIAKKDTAEKKAVVREEKKPVAKTFSKKDKKAASASASKGKKFVSPKKTKTEGKVKTEGKSKKTKGKAKPAPKSSEEEEDDVEMVDERDSAEEADPTSDADEEDEMARTPGSKLPILGNLACSSRDGNCTALLDHAVEQLGKYNVVSYGADSDCSLSAYIIGKDTKRGWGLLQALACGAPLVSDEWLSTSISEGKWKPIDMFRSDRFGQSPRTVDGATTASSKLLEGVRVKVHCTGKDEPSVRKMLRICGARIAETRMDVVINDTGKPVGGPVNVVKKWLADSIEAGMPLDHAPYVVGA